MKLEANITDKDVPTRYDTLPAFTVCIIVRRDGHMPYYSNSIHEKLSSNETVIAAFDRLKKEILSTIRRTRPELFK